MTVYVDPPQAPPRLDSLDPAWPLLTTNGPVDELHAFARSIGVGRGWFSEHPAPCYALTRDARDRAVDAGARPALSVVTTPAQRPDNQRQVRSRWSSPAERGPCGPGPGAAGVQRFLTPATISLLALWPLDFAFLSARFSFRDLPTFLLMACRGDLSLMVAPSSGAWTAPAQTVRLTRVTPRRRRHDRA